jgi:hypothetical protein
VIVKIHRRMGGKECFKNLVFEVNEESGIVTWTVNVCFEKCFSKNAICFISTETWVIVWESLIMQKVKINN